MPPLDPNAWIFVYSFDSIARQWLARGWWKGRDVCAVVLEREPWWIDRFYLLDAAERPIGVGVVMRNDAMQGCAAFA